MMSEYHKTISETRKGLGKMYKHLPTAVKKEIQAAAMQTNGNTTKARKMAQDALNAYLEDGPKHMRKGAGIASAFERLRDSF